MLMKLFAGLTVVICLALAGAAALGTFSNPAEAPIPTGSVEPTSAEPAPSCCKARKAAPPASEPAPSCCAD